MARQNSGLKSIPRLLHMLFLMVWVVVSVTSYGFCCAIAGMFSKKIAQGIGRVWNRHLLFLARIRVEVHGSEKLADDTCYVFFANHQSALDIPVLFTGLRQPLVFIAKKELFWIPLMGWGMHGMGHIVLDRSNPRKARDALTKAVKRLHRHRFSLTLFPEGTRSMDGALADFKQGSFALALEAGVPVVPVAIEKTNECLRKKSMVIRPGTVYLTVCDPIVPQGMEKSQLAAKVRAEIQNVLNRRRTNEIKDD
ncbi:MAG: 1-acyl-sn-glycerol-3-phosphate acyltransferase [Chitinispirillaceae bacterium]|nr:1-acyl-sn-glycerol-3-phosphate acyltransferase [Chitinispirillaceae bacterium]